MRERRGTAALGYVQWKEREELAALVTSLVGLRSS